MTADPIKLFQDWYTVARDSSPLRYPGAVCLSTVDPEGFPDARFVDLKSVSDTGFVFCTRYDSFKGISLSATPRAALAFWWDHIGRQVRVIGSAERVSEAEADAYFQERPRDAQITTLASHQSAPLEDSRALERRLQELQAEFRDAEVPRPAAWGGYRVAPARMEFLSFKATRLHERLQFRRRGTTWESRLLQP